MSYSLFSSSSPSPPARTTSQQHRKGGSRRIAQEHPMLPSPSINSAYPSNFAMSMQQTNSSNRPVSYPPPSAPPSPAGPKHLASIYPTHQQQLGHAHTTHTHTHAHTHGHRPVSSPYKHAHSLQQQQQHLRSNTETLGHVLAASGDRMMSTTSERDKVKTTTRVLSLATQYLRGKIEGFSSMDLSSALSLSGGGNDAAASSRALAAASRQGHGANFGTIRPVPRQLLNYHVRQRENGAWQATVSLVQPFVRGSWTDPQGTRPGYITMGFYGTEEGALAACQNNAPPVWAEPVKGCQCYMCHSGGKSLQKNPVHCRNCGQMVCSKCSKSRWPNGMVPPTYHNSERTVRVCDACNHLAWNFRRALKEGDQRRALELFASGNINVWSPYLIEQVREFPVHCAAEGGNLRLLRWLVEELGCPLYETDEAPLVNHQGDSVLGVAARHQQVSIMRWLVQVKECKISEITDRQQLWNTVEFLLKAPEEGKKGVEEEEDEIVLQDDGSESESDDGYIPAAPAATAAGTTTTSRRINMAGGRTSSSRRMAGVGGGSARRLVEKCLVCRGQEADTLLLPCGHLCTCASCSSACKKCPACKTAVKKVVRTFRVSEA